MVLSDNEQCLEGKNEELGTIEESKNQLITEIDRRLEDKIIEKTNADLLKKLIKNADTLQEAIAVAELGTTYKRTGFHFDKLQCVKLFLSSLCSSYFIKVFPTPGRFYQAAKLLKISNYFSF